MEPLKSSISIDQMVEDLSGKLESIARSLVDTSDPRNFNFATNPDDFSEHSPAWHQWGVLTHTANFLQCYEQEAPALVADWGMTDQVNGVLSQEIDGVSKADLLRIAILLHDIGKFKREFRTDGFPNYDGHERKSEGLILGEESIQILLRDEYGLTDAQIVYIGRCAGLHFEFGKMRNVAKRLTPPTPDQDIGSGAYTMNFIGTSVCDEECRRIAKSAPDYAVEVGLLFLLDNLSKTDVRECAGLSSNAEIVARRGVVQSLLAQRGLNPALEKMILQFPVNVAVARRYLKLLFDARFSEIQIGLVEKEKCPENFMNVADLAPVVEEFFIQGLNTNTIRLFCYGLYGVDW